MPTSDHFRRCPEFPSNVSVADIPIISFRELETRGLKHYEDEQLFKACTMHGFFLLDLQKSENGETLLKDAEAMYEICAATLNLAPQELQEYAWKPPNLFGYKPAGKLKTDDGKLDTTHIYSISQDDMLGNCARRKNPPPVESRRDDIAAFIQHAHRVVNVIFSSLDVSLGLAPGTLATFSSLDKTSETFVRLILSRPQAEDCRVTLPGHTDIGSITMLFHVVGGLQILPAGKENIDSNWQYIRPQANCALINIGDTLVEWTGGILRSSLHRVVNPPGLQASVTRQSLAYLVRPDQTKTMHRLKSSVIPALPDSEEEESRSVDEWARWRAQQIIDGEVKPQGRGGLLGDIKWAKTGLEV